MQPKQQVAKLLFGCLYPAVITSVLTSAHSDSVALSLPPLPRFDVDSLLSCLSHPLFEYLRERPWV